MVGVVALFLAATLSLAAPASEINLWATISVPEAAFHVTETETLMVSFTVTNAGTTAVDVETGSSQLFVNGEIPEGWAIVMMNGIRNPLMSALKPGQTTEFNKGLGRYFAKPGVYKVRWKGLNFETSEITFRVVPD